MEVGSEDSSEGGRVGNCEGRRGHPRNLASPRAAGGGVGESEGRIARGHTPGRVGVHASTHPARSPAAASALPPVRPREETRGNNFAGWRIARLSRAVGPAGSLSGDDVAKWAGVRVRMRASREPVRTRTRAPTNVDTHARLPPRSRSPVDSRRQRLASSEDSSVRSTLASRCPSPSPPPRASARPSPRAPPRSPRSPAAPPSS